MESEHIERAEHATASHIQSAEEQDPKLSSSSDSSYAIITKYDSCYLKSTAGFLRFLHVVGYSELLFFISADRNIRLCDDLLLTLVIGVGYQAN